MKPTLESAVRIDVPIGRRGGSRANSASAKADEPSDSVTISSIFVAASAAWALLRGERTRPARNTGTEARGDWKAHHRLCPATRRGSPSAFGTHTRTFQFDQEARVLIEADVWTVQELRTFRGTYDRPRPVWHRGEYGGH